MVAPAVAAGSHHVNVGECLLCGMLGARAVVEEGLGPQDLKAGGLVAGWCACRQGGAGL